MHWQFFELIILMFAVGVAACGMLYAGYSSGRYAAFLALQNRSSKWKAYMAALVPPALFGIMFQMDKNLAPLAAQAFLSLAAPAAIGACLRYGAGLEDL